MDSANRNIVLDMLLSAEGRFVSGEHIGIRLGASRTAVWKYISELKKMGYEIESHPRSGYKLISSPDLLWPDEIKRGLDVNVVGRDIMFFKSIPSTNDKAKELAAGGCDEGLVVVAEEQTGGRGRLGRKWASPPGKGIWMSVVLRPRVQPIEVQKLTLLAALAVVHAVRECAKLEPAIKWPNDIVMSHKKVCGILTELNAEMEMVNYVVVGVGLNVNLEQTDIPESLRYMATSLRLEVGHKLDRKHLLRSILKHMDELYQVFMQPALWGPLMDDYRRYCVNIGRKAVINDGICGSWEAMVVDVGDDGALIVRTDDGREKRIISGEVSVRGVEGYV